MKSIRICISLLAFFLGIYAAMSQCWPQADKLVPDQLPDNTDLFGTAIDYQDDYAAVGAPASDTVQVRGGAVYLFHFTGTSWSKVATLVPSDPRANQYFGRTARFSGDYLYVGDPEHIVNGVASTGLIYVFKKPTSGWTNAVETFTITPSDPNARRFGAALDTYEETLLVGAPLTNNGVTEVGLGAAYVLERSGDAWTQIAKFSLSGTLGASLGVAVSLKRNIAAVLSDYENYGSSGAAGATYVFTKEEGIGWTDATPVARLSRSGPLGNLTYFNASIDVDESRQTVFVSGYYYDVDTQRSNPEFAVYVKPIAGWTNMTENTSFGSVELQNFYVYGKVQFDDPYLYFTKSDEVKIFRPGADNTWATPTLTGSLRNTDNSEGQRFGAALRSKDGHLFVGATGAYSFPSHRYVAPAIPGVYQFDVPGGGWSDVSYSEDFQFTYMPKTSSDFAYGSVIDMDGQYAVVGATRDRADGSRSGAAYLYHLEGLEWKRVAKLTPSDGEYTDTFGYSVAISKDHVAVGAYYKNYRASPTDPISDNNLGAVYVFSKPTDGWKDMTETFKILKDESLANERDDNYFGTSVDMDYPYLVVSRYDHGARPNNGSVFVYELNGSGAALQATLIPSTRNGVNNFGYNLKIQNDVIVVTTGATRVAAIEANMAFVYVRKNTGWVSGVEDAILFPSDASSSLSGIAFGVGVDMNESANTIIIGAPGWREPTDPILDGFKGAAYIYEKPAQGWKGFISEKVKLWVPGQPAFGSMGVSVHIEDRYAFVGSPQGYFYLYAASNAGPGRVYFYEKPENGWSYKLPDKTIIGDEFNEHDTDYFGSAVDGVFGYAFIGAIADDNQGSVDAGSVYVYTEYPFILPGQTPICTNEEPVQLKAYPEGGIWSGLGFSNPMVGLFDPGLSQKGSFLVKYRVDDCDASNSLLIEVIDPVSPFSLAATDSLFFCGQPKVMLSAPQHHDYSVEWQYAVEEANLKKLDHTFSELEAQEEGFYKAIVTNGCSIETSSVWVGDLYPDGGGPFEICRSAEPFSLPGNYPNGVWVGSGVSDGKRFSASGLPNGLYTLNYTVSPANACVYSDATTLLLRGIDKLEVESDDADEFCFTGNATLTATSSHPSALTFDWLISNGDHFLPLNKHESSISVEQLGRYRVVANDQVCSREADFDLAPAFSPKIDPLFESIQFCHDNPGQLVAEAVPGATYTWWRHGEDEVTLVEETVGDFKVMLAASGIFHLQINSHGCEFITEPMEVQIIPEASLFVPNVITPNGDGRNDFFEIEANESIREYSLVIVNRYGKDVYRYQGSERATGWSAEGLTTGVYFWSISYFSQCENQMKTVQGSLSILR